jgi:hypothetical protein
LPPLLRNLAILKIGGPVQKPGPAFIQGQRPVDGKRAGFEHEAFMLFQERLAPTSGREAFDLSLRTLCERAKSSEIVIPIFGEQENVNLMVGDSDTSSLKQIDDGPIARAVERGQIVEAIDRYGQIDISAFVKDLDPMTPERLEAGHFAYERPRH